MERKTAMRHAFENAKVKTGDASSPLIKRVLRVMERGAGVRGGGKKSKQ